jgi:hypothetical protein
MCDHYRRSVGKSVRPTAEGGQRKTDCGWSPNLSKLRAVCGRCLIVVRHASVNPPTAARDGQKLSDQRHHPKAADYSHLGRCAGDYCMGTLMAPPSPPPSSFDPERRLCADRRLRLINACDFHHCLSGRFHRSGCSLSSRLTLELRGVAFSTRPTHKKSLLCRVRPSVGA